MKRAQSETYFTVLFSTVPAFIQSDVEMVSSEVSGNAVH